MLDLPYATHRSLIEPLTGEKHVKKILLSKFLGFMEKIEKSGKKAWRMLKDTSMKDVRSVTGSNYRSIAPCWEIFCLRSHQSRCWPSWILSNWWQWKVESWKHSRNYQYKKWVDGSSWFWVGGTWWSTGLPLHLLDGILFLHLPSWSFPGVLPFFKINMELSIQCS